MFHHMRKFSSTVKAATAASSPISEVIINKGISKIPADHISLRPFKITDVDDLMAWGTDEKLSRYCNWQVPKSSVDDPRYCNWLICHPVRRLGPGLFNRMRPYCHHGWGLSIYKSKEDALDDMKNNMIPHPWFKAICLNNRPIGKIFVDPCVPKDPYIGEIGYVVASEHWGKGIATTAVNMVLDTIFNEWPHLDRLQAQVNVENLAGQRVLEKTGFECEDVKGSTGLPMYFLDKEGRDIEIYTKSFSFLRENFIKRGDK